MHLELQLSLGTFRRINRRISAKRHTRILFITSTFITARDASLFCSASLADLRLYRHERGFASAGNWLLMPSWRLGDAVWRKDRNGGDLRDGKGKWNCHIILLEIIINSVSYVDDNVTMALLLLASVIIMIMVKVVMTTTAIADIHNDYDDNNDSSNDNYGDDHSRNKIILSLLLLYPIIYISLK